MLSRDTLDALPDIVAQRISGANEYMLKLLGDNIKRIGKMTAKDAHQLEELYRAGEDVRKIQRELAKRTGKSVAEIKAIFDEYAELDVDRSKNAYLFRGRKFIPYHDNAYLQKFVASFVAQTAGTLANLAQTTALQIWSAKTGGYTSLAAGYKDAIDQAITNVALGVQDYQSAMRDTLRKVGQTGLCTVEYESGRTRRLDTAVRANILEGVRQVNQGIEDRLGEELGADGVEISAHNYCAPDHADIQGKQMTKEAYKKWDAAHAYPKRQIGKLNCHHFVYSIILGVDEPIVSPEELAEMKAKNEKGVEYEGKHYTMYQATQVQRAIETEIRRCKDVHIIASAAGDKVLQTQMDGSISQLIAKYNDFTDKAGLSRYSRRYDVDGYKKSK